MPNLSINTLKIELIRSSAGETTFEQGQRLFTNERVEVLKVTDQFALCKVLDRQEQAVEIRVQKNYLYLKCSCGYAVRGIVCEHEVAAALKVHEYLHERLPKRWKVQLNNWLDNATPHPRRGSRPHSYFLLFSLQSIASYGLKTWRISPYQLPASVLPKEMRDELVAILAPDDRLSIPDEASSSQARTQGWERLSDYIETTPDIIDQLKFPYRLLNPDGCVNGSKEGVILANFILQSLRSLTTPIPIEDSLLILARVGMPLFLGNSANPLEKAIQIMNSPGEISLHVIRKENGLRLSARIISESHSFPIKQGSKFGEIQIISQTPLWILADRCLFTLQKNTPSELLAVLMETPELLIPAEDEADFLDKSLLPLANKIKLEGDGLTWESVQSDPVGRLYLVDEGGELSAELRFGYGDFELPYDPQYPTENIVHQPGSWTLVRVQRKPEAEANAYNRLTARSSGRNYGLKRSRNPAQPEALSLKARVHPVDFLLHHVPDLIQDGFEIYGEERLKTARVNRYTPSISFSVSSGIDWFDVKAVVTFGEIEVSLKEIRHALRKKEQYIKLADGTIGEIPPEWIDRYRHLFGLSEENGENLRLSSHHLGLLDEILSGANQTKTDVEFERRRQRLRDFAGIQDVPLPQGFYGELRPYQKAGYDWLHFLHEFEFGGCLADDMGLGKTIQALAFLQSLREGIGTAPKAQEDSPGLPVSLIVVPRSLLVNWQREAARFTPQLRLLEYFESDRPKDTAIFNSYDVVVTTYGVMLRDIDLLHQYPFHYVILDESQVIKNPLALTARAARHLQASHRLVLTGTPVENSTIELWSQFAFLNPGLLGNLEYFKNEFGTLIEKKGDEKAAEFLRRMVYPFILRRTKDQVAPELPPRTERILYTDMEPAQRKLYLRMRDVYRSMLLGIIENEGMNASRMKILEGLLRLRQICNHPHLVDDKFRGDSGKFELLIETLETLRSEGHKALVFSQFVQMLRIVRATLDQRQIPYTYLDGRTRNRQERVDTFQNDPNIPFFLISLKAGGTGLNLTAADYVIHIDPWWNPAVEMQASDRTHRIGQDKPVFVFKLITRDSVEEKILLLQERKKTLVEQLITTEQDFLKDLTVDDVKALFS